MKCSRCGTTIVSDFPESCASPEDRFYCNSCFAQIRPKHIFPDPVEFYKRLLSFEVVWVGFFSILALVLIFH